MNISKAEGLTYMIRHLAIYNRICTVAERDTASVPLADKEPPMAASLLRLATAADRHTEPLPPKVLSHYWLT